MNITSTDITTAAYTFLVIGGFLALVANIVAYLVNKTASKKKKGR